MFRSKFRHLVAIVVVSSAVVSFAAEVAHAAVGAGASVTFPTIVSVGQTGLPASITLSNFNTSPNDLDTNIVCNAGDAAPCPAGGQGITLIPSCGQFVGATCIVPDAGVFAISATATGRLGTACGSTTFAITVIDPTFGTVRFTPQPPGANVILPPLPSCTIDFTFSVVRTPTFDQDFPTPAIQTGQVLGHVQHNGVFSAQGIGTRSVTVLRAAAATLATTASADITLGAGSLTDTAVVSGRVNPVAGATVTFTLYGPDDATCGGAPIFAPAPVPQPVADGGVTSPPFTPTTAGTYRWIASYTGDANNAPVSGACNDANETVVVALAGPTIATTASAGTVVGGGTLTDSATVTGRVNPQAGATIDFRLYGPNDAACAGTPVFQSLTVAYPVAGGRVASAAFTPTTAGTYRWIASYSGDVNNAPVSGACNDANETVVVAPAGPTLATTASADISLGAGSVNDTVVVSGRVNPQAGATVTFTLFGPNNATCIGGPIFTSTVAYPVAGGPVASAAFTPTTAGTYRWIAGYSGDVNNAPVSGACNDANETTVVNLAVPTLATTASAGIVVGSGTLTDSATVTGRVNPQAGATIDFRLYGPNDAACAGTPVFQSLAVAYPVAGGTVTSAAFTPTTAGTYRWTASYSGDVNNTAVAGACNAANESVTVAQAVPSLVTTSSPNIVIGGQVTDTAVVSGRVNPQAGATVTFTLFGPGDTTCATTPIFQSTVAYPVAGGAVTSTPFTPVSAGTYRWRASYSGDANNAVVASPCNDANETVGVTPLFGAGAGLPATGAAVGPFLYLALLLSLTGCLLFGPTFLRWRRTTSPS